MADNLSGEDQIVERLTGATNRMAFHLRGDVLVGVWALGCVCDFALARRWLGQEARISALHLSDTCVPLKASLVS